MDSVTESPGAAENKEVAEISSTSESAKADVSVSPFISLRASPSSPDITILPLVEEALTQNNANATVMELRRRESNAVKADETHKSNDAGDTPALTAVADELHSNLVKENSVEIDTESESQNESKPGSRVPSPRPCGNSEVVTYTLSLHHRTDYAEELIINPDVFPDIQVGDIVEIQHPPSELKNRSEEVQYEPLVMQVTTIVPIRGTVQISLLKSIASSKFFNLRNFQPVCVTKVEEIDRIEIHYIEITFKDQYISQGEFWLLKQSIVNKTCYIGHTISLYNMNVQIDDIIGPGNQPMHCGVITANTKFIFRSCSARLYWLVQLSKEMWDFSDDGELYFELLIKFLHKVLEGWNTKDVRHSLSIIFFTRTYFNAKPTDATTGRSPVNEDYAGRPYIDLYHSVLENDTRADWFSILVHLKQQFLRFPSIAKWDINFAQKGQHQSFPGKGKAAGKPKICGLPSTAHEGNCLEAINLCMNVLDKHFMDRDLSRTGNAIVLFTAGTGVFEVDRTLTNITEQRMTDNAIGCDVISLTRAPLHTVPLFVYFPSKNSEMGVDVLDRPHPFASTNLYKLAGKPNANSNLHNSIHRLGSSSPAAHMQHPPGGKMSQLNLNDMHHSGSSSSIVLKRSESYNTLSSDGYTPKVQPFKSGAAPARDRNIEYGVLPVYNVPYWMHLSFPFQPQMEKAPGTASELVYNYRFSQEAMLMMSSINPSYFAAPNKAIIYGFKPLPMSRMFELCDPKRSSMPLALLEAIHETKFELESRVVRASHKRVDSLANRGNIMDVIKSVANYVPDFNEVLEFSDSEDSDDSSTTTISTVATENNQKKMYDQSISRMHHVPSRGKLNAYYPLVRDVKGQSYKSTPLASQRHLLHVSASSNAVLQLGDNSSSRHEPLAFEDSSSYGSYGSKLGTQKKGKRRSLLGSHTPSHSLNSVIFEEDEYNDPSAPQDVDGTGEYSNQSILHALSNAPPSSKSPPPRSPRRSIKSRGKFGSQPKSQLLRFNRSSSTNDNMQSTSSINLANQAQYNACSKQWMEETSKMEEDHMRKDKLKFSHQPPGSSPRLSSAVYAPSPRLAPNSLPNKWNANALNRNAVSLSNFQAPSLAGSLRSVEGRKVSNNKITFQEINLASSLPENETNLEESGSIMDMIHSRNSSRSSFDNLKGGSPVDVGSFSQKSKLLDDSRFVSWEERHRFRPGVQVVLPENALFTDVGVVLRKPAENDTEKQLSSAAGRPHGSLNSPDQQYHPRHPAVSVNNSLPSTSPPSPNLMPISKSASFKRRSERLPLSRQGTGSQFPISPVLRPLSSHSASLEAGATKQKALIRKSQLDHSVNPFDLSQINSEYHHRKKTTNRMRWSHLFPTGRFEESESKPDSTLPLSKDEEEEAAIPVTIESYRPNWKSLNSPGILPLTTSLGPSQNEIETNFNQNNYSLTNGDGDSSDYKNNQILLREMVGQRLSQGFQIVKSEDEELKPDVFTLSIGREVHTLENDKQDGTVQIRLYTERKQVDIDATYTYCYNLYDPMQDKNVAMDCRITGAMEKIFWNSLDNTLCGQNDDLTATKQYRRQMFTMMPSLSLNAQTRRHSDNLNPAVAKEAVASVNRQSGAFSERNTSNNTSSTAKNISIPLPPKGKRYSHSHISTPPLSELFPRNSTVNYGNSKIMYRNASVSHDSTNILASGVSVSGSRAASSSSISLNMGDNDSVITDCFSTDSVVGLNKVDENILTPQEENDVINNFTKFASWLQSQTESKMTPLNLKVVRRYPKPQVDGEEGEFAFAEVPYNANSNITRLAAARKINIRKTNRSGRNEWLLVRHDNIFSPYQCFHLEVQWMACSGVNVTNFIQILLRRTRMQNIHMQQIPEYCRSTAQGYDRRVPHPFILPHVIEFSLPFTSHSAFYNYLVQTIKVMFGFVVDSVTGDGFHSLVHLNGSCFLIFKRKAIEVVQNRLLATPSKKAPLHQFAHELYTKLVDFCKEVDQCYLTLHETIKLIEDEAKKI